METLDSAIYFLEQNCFMASIDLKDAYFSIPIACEHRKYLRFQWRDKLYQFCVLPFGLASAPRVFTKVLKPMIAHLRSHGYMSCNYIDDALLIGKTRNECELNVQARIDLCNELGFTINQKKSLLHPNKRVEFLGFILDSSNMSISLPFKRAEVVMQACIHLSILIMQKLEKFLG